MASLPHDPGAPGRLPARSAAGGVLAEAALGRYEFGPFLLDGPAHRLLRDGAPVRLPPKAFDALLVLVARAGRLVAKEELLAAVWQDAYVEEGNLKVTIFQLRRALGAAEGGLPWIETVPRRGYRFAATVQRSPGEADGAVRGAEEAGGDDRPPAAAASPARPRRSSSVAGAILAVVVLAAGAAGLWLAVRPAAVSLEGLRVAPLVTGGRVRAAAISPDGGRIAYSRREASGDTLHLLQVETGDERPLLPASPEALTGLQFSRDGGFLYYAAEGALWRVSALGGRRPAVVARDVDAPVAVSPDGARAAFVRFAEGTDATSTLWLLDLSGGGRRALVTRRGPEFLAQGAIAFSADGGHLAFASGSAEEGLELHTLALAGGEPLRTGDGRWENVSGIAWLGDGSGIAVAAREEHAALHQVWLQPLPGGDLVRLTHGLGDHLGLSAARSERALAAVQRNRLASLWTAPAASPATQRPLTDGSGGAEGEAGLAHGPDGLVVYASHGGERYDLWLTDPAAGRPLRLTHREGANVWPAVTPDGRSVVFSSNRDGRFRLWAMDLAGGPARRLTAGEDDRYLDLTPDGRWIVFQRGGGRPSLWTLSAAGGEPRRLADAIASRPDVSPDGRHVACNLFDEAADRWRAAVVSFPGGRLVRTFPAMPASPWRIVRWSPDGSALTYLTQEPADEIGLWSQPLAGGEPRLLARLPGGSYFDFAWSPDGASIAFARGSGARDVVILRGF